MKLRIFKETVKSAFRTLLPTIGFILGVVSSAYLLTSVVEWNINIAEWTKWGRLALILFSAGIFQVFTRLGANSK